MRRGRVAGVLEPHLHRPEWERFTQNDPDLAVLNFINWNTEVHEHIVSLVQFCV